MSDLIPRCGCRNPNKEYKLYKVQNPQVLDIDSQENTVEITKKHIFHNGPVIAGFFVLDNFMSGNHTRMNGGVYLENGIYTDPSQIQFEDNPDFYRKFKGGHTVSVMGWGVARNILVDNKGTRKDVPYWHVRNSWVKTGDKGYFKIAMYPYNK